MKKISNKTYRKLFISFFIVMLLLTFLSRALDSILIPKIQIEAYTSGNLTYVLEGEGSIQSSSTKYVSIPSGIRVDQVLSVGEHVSKGQGLVSLRVSDLENKKKEAQRTLDKMQLTLEKENLSAKTTPRISEPEKMAWNMLLEEKRLNEALANLKTAEEEYTKNVSAITTKRDRDRHFAEQQLALSKEEVNLLNQESASSVSGNTAKKNTSQSELTYQMEIARIDEEYQSSLQQAESKRKEASENVNQIQDSYNTLLYNSSLAAKTEDNLIKSEQVTNQIAKKSQAILQIDISAQKEVVQVLENLLVAKGQVESSYDGLLTQMEVIPGSTTSGEEIVAVSGGNFLLTAPLSKENVAVLSEGDKLNVTISSEAQSITATISTISIPTDSKEVLPDEEHYAQFSAALSDGEYRIGSSARYKITKSSSVNYPCLLPIEALREDDRGTYCLIAENNSTILGEEDIATRISLEVLAKSDTHVAINSALTKSDRIIVGSNKAIKEGDRVRIE